jgi:hyperosmotically inducible protein
MLQKLSALVGVAVLAVACAQTDAGITTNIKSKMAVDDAVKAYQLNVDTRNGVVTLTGDVDSQRAKDRAVQIARSTGGVREVVDHIMVTEAAPTGGGVEPGHESLEEKAREEGREIAGEARKPVDWAERVASDAAITTAVKTKFLADSMVGGLKINVDTNDHVVTLSGNVASRAEADRAVMMARNTEGVTRVVDNLRVGK